MYKVVLIRHGQSLWNKENRFTGWTDVDLSEQGETEAKTAGEKLKSENYEFDTIYTSKLKRAQRTAAIVNDTLGQNIPTIENWRLNERHYGALQGLNKKETAEKHGADQVQIWRRSFDTKPPLLPEEKIEKPAEADIPALAGESLKDTIERTVPYWNETIAPEIKSGKNILIAAHGNSLRALMKHIFSISDEEITSLEIPTGKPLVCQLDENLNGLEYNYL
jgi:2,3-bisphosphoglycerate-dependent phosphoglycerate mutase